MLNVVDPASALNLSDAQIQSTLSLAIEEANALESWGRLLDSDAGKPLQKLVVDRKEAIRDLYGKINITQPEALALLGNFQGREEELSAILNGRDEQTRLRRKKELARVIEVCKNESNNRKAQRSRAATTGNGILYQEEKP